MTTPRRLLSIVAALVVALQPLAACCGELVVVDASALHASAEHDHCGDPAPAEPTARDDACECRDSCASLTARPPVVPDIALLTGDGQGQPIAAIMPTLSPPPVPHLVPLKGQAPPATALPANATLFSLKRLLLL
ncbi:MAG: hypothetical protein AAGD86_02875 [Pseudomonadota bacterium]